MSVSDEGRWLEALHRGKLTESDEAQVRAYLSAHPEEQAACERELALNHLLDQLPAAPVSSNFTAQVVQAVRKEQSRPERPSRFGWPRLGLRSWLPKVTVLATAAVLATLAYRQHELAQHRELARNLVEISRFASDHSLDILKDFEAIQRLDQLPRHPNADRELIAALQ
ncbi:MAG: hypothetical protein U1G07_05380 [Verrucomicrobiota bacterium]